MADQDNIPMGVPPGQDPNPPTASQPPVAQPAPAQAQAAGQPPAQAQAPYPGQPPAGQPPAQAQAPYPGHQPQAHSPYPGQPAHVAAPPAYYTGQPQPQAPPGAYPPPPPGPQPQAQQQPVQWMAAPTDAPAGCPPGLEYLTHIDQVLVHQQIELFEMITNFETQNRYRIRNTLGQQVYFAAEESSVLQRQCCGPGRAFQMSITDNSNKEIPQGL